MSVPGRIGNDPLTVTGGSEGISAHVEDLEAVAAEFRAAAAEVDDIVAYAAAWALLRAPSYVLPVHAAADLALTTLVAPGSRARRAADALRGSADGLAAAALEYAIGDRSVFAAGPFGALTDLLGGFAGAFGAATDAVTTAVSTGSPVAGLEQIAIDEPVLADVLATSLLSTGVLSAVAAGYPDGHARVQDLGSDLSERTAPRRLADLVDQLADRNETEPGEVSISFVTGADGRRRAIVDIPGTKSWTPGPSDDITSLSTNARAIVGAPTSYEQGVLRAMGESGIRPDDEVMLVGHSEGGMVAVNTARDAVAGKRFTVTHVVTAGSPVGRTVDDVPASVRVLALENRADVVPHLDGADNPDRPNVTTVAFSADHGDIVHNHALRESYALGAADCDASNDASVRAFLDSADGFLSGRSERTHAFLITRGY